MTFEAYAREWLERQNFIKSTSKWTRQGLEIYTFPVITEYLHQTDESIHESAVRRQEYLEKIMREFGTAPDEGQADGNG